MMTILALGFSRAVAGTCRLLQRNRDYVDYVGPEGCMDLQVLSQRLLRWMTGRTHISTHNKHKATRLVAQEAHVEVLRSRSSN